MTTIQYFVWVITRLMRHMIWHGMWCIVCQAKWIIGVPPGWQVPLVRGILGGTNHITVTFIKISWGGLYNLWVFLGWFFNFILSQSFFWFSCYIDLSISYLFTILQWFSINLSLYFTRGSQNPHERGSCRDHDTPTHSWGSAAVMGATQYCGDQETK